MAGTVVGMTALFVLAGVALLAGAAAVLIGWVLHRGMAPVDRGRCERR